MSIKEQLLDVYADGGEWEDFEPIIDQLLSQLAEARRVIEPFAIESQMWGKSTPSEEIPFIKSSDGSGDYAAFTYGNLRAAAEWIAKQGS